MGFNTCPFQPLRSYKRHEENKSKIGQEACSRPTTNVIGPLHECKKVCPCTKALPVRHSRMNQARSEEEEKERKRDRKDRGQEADGKKGSPTKEKPI